jgi:HEPN pEK499 p136
MFPHEPAIDLLRRTLFNLEYIEERKAPEGPFETTQLINSFLAGLAHPWERWREEISDMSIEEAERKGWPTLATGRTSDRKARTLKELIRLMRNGLAHGNIELVPRSHEIYALHIWNVPKNGQRDWGVTVTVNQMRQFLLRLAELFELHFGRAPEPAVPTRDAS